MGEIRIKSGNLYTIELGDDRWRTLGNGQIISRTDGVLQIETSSERNSGVYALSTSAIGQLSDIRSTVSYSFDIRADTDISVLVGYEVQGARVLLHVSDEWVTVKVENILFTQSYNFTIVNRSSGGTVYLRNFMLNEGSTALPYEPYFLNRPAHQKTSTGWKDIPTHTMTATGWQGELTSQSPLEFKATGQSLLDWRVDGKTSENLFDINSEYTSNSRKGIQCFVVDDDKLVVQIISPGGTTRITYPNNFYNPAVYTVSAKLTGELTSIRFLSTSPFPGGTYNATYKAYFKSMTLNDGIYTITVSPTETTTIGFAVMGADDAQNPGTVENIQILSGTYTSSTIPPYEPYGGVGDWDETAQKYKIPVTVNGVTTNIFTDHQLLDGDSIDYATTETQIPLATGNNTLTVDTAVKPSKVFVKFEG